MPCQTTSGLPMLGCCQEVAVEEGSYAELLIAQFWGGASPQMFEIDEEFPANQTWVRYTKATCRFDSTLAGWGNVWQEVDLYWPTSIAGAIPQQPELRDIRRGADFGNPAFQFDLTTWRISDQGPDYLIITLNDGAFYWRVDYSDPVAMVDDWTFCVSAWAIFDTDLMPVGTNEISIRLNFRWFLDPNTLLWTADGYGGVAPTEHSRMRMEGSWTWEHINGTDQNGVNLWVHPYPLTGGGRLGPSAFVVPNWTYWMSKRLRKMDSGPTRTACRYSFSTPGFSNGVKREIICRQEVISGHFLVDPDPGIFPDDYTGNAQLAEQQLAYYRYRVAGETRTAILPPDTVESVGTPSCCSGAP